jgi:hypothetical protein
MHPWTDGLEVSAIGLGCMGMSSATVRPAISRCTRLTTWLIDGALGAARVSFAGEHPGPLATIRIEPARAVLTRDRLAFECRSSDTPLSR